MRTKTLVDCARPRVNLINEPFKVIKALLPGPVTIVLPRGEAIPTHVNPDTTTVACRIPDNDLTRNLCRLGPG